MVAREAADGTAVASYIKRIVEEETGDKYVLKSRAELVHPDNLSWYLHLPAGAAGWIGHVRQEGKSSLVFESVYIYDADNVIEFEYRYSLKIDGLKSDLSAFHLKEVREKYSRVLPKVVKFFDKAEETLSAVNETHGTKLELVNSGGLVTVKIEIGLEQAWNDEALVRENIQAMKDFLTQIVDWQNEQRARSTDMAQIRKSHNQALAESK